MLPVAIGNLLPSLAILGSMSSFPHALGPFSVLRTPLRHADFTLATFDGQIEDGCAWLVEEEVLRRHLIVASDREEFPLMSQLSPLTPITVDAATRCTMHVPDEAVSFCWAYPSDTTADLRTSPAAERGLQTLNASLVLGFLSFGGYLYLDHTGSVCAATTIVPDAASGRLKFAPPQPLQREWALALTRADAWKRITIGALHDAGARWFAWIAPGKPLVDADGKPLASQPEAADGAFAYLFHYDVEAIAQADCYFALGTMPTERASPSLAAPLDSAGIALLEQDAATPGGAQPSPPAAAPSTPSPESATAAASASHAIATVTAGSGAAEGRAEAEPVVAAAEATSSPPAIQFVSTVVNAVNVFAFVGNLAKHAQDSHASQVEASIEPPGSSRRALDQQAANERRRPSGGAASDSPAALLALEPGSSGRPGPSPITAALLSSALRKMSEARTHQMALSWASAHAEHADEDGVESSAAEGGQQQEPTSSTTRAAPTTHAVPTTHIDESAAGSSGAGGGQSPSLR